MGVAYRPRPARKPTAIHRVAPRTGGDSDQRSHGAAQGTGRSRSGSAAPVASPGKLRPIELSEYGMELQDIVFRLGRWGAKAMGDPRADEIITVDSLIMAMRTTFRPAAARGVRATYELRIGDITLHTRIRGARLEVGKGSSPGADLVIETGPAIKALMTGEVSPAEAIASGSVRLTGDEQLLERFVEIFYIATDTRNRRTGSNVQSGLA